MYFYSELKLVGSFPNTLQPSPYLAHFTSYDSQVKMMLVTEMKEYLVQGHHCVGSILWPKLWVVEDKFGELPMQHYDSPNT